MENNRTKELELDEKALQYAERYGIYDYQIKNNKMIWYRSYPAYLSQPHYTVKHTLDLITMQETTQKLKKFRKAGKPYVI